MLISFGKRRSGDMATDAQVVQSAPDCAQTSLDIAKALAMCQLCECHAQPLIPTGEAAHSVVSLIEGDATLKLTVGNKRHELGEYRSSLVHPAMDGSNRQPIFKSFLMSETPML